MASKTSRKEWVRGLPWAFGAGRYERKRLHWASERSVGYVFLIEDRVRNHPNPHLYQTGSKVRRSGLSRTCSGRAASSASLLRAGKPGIGLGCTSPVCLRLLSQRFMDGIETPKTSATSWRGLPRSTAASTLNLRSFEYGFIL